MSNENNVVSFEQKVNSTVESAIIDGLSNRGGNQVSEVCLINLGARANDDISLVFGVIENMVSTGVLEKSFHSASDSMHRSYRLPMYRLAPKGW